MKAYSGHMENKIKTKSKSRPKLTHKTDFPVRARVFLVPSYLFGTALTSVILAPTCSALSSRRGARRVDSMLH